MNNLFHWILPLVFVSCTATPKVTPAIPSDPVIEQKIETLLNKMTLDEKIGQMTQLVADLLAPDPQALKEGRAVLNQAMMDSIFGKYKVGSILNAPFTRAHTAASWNALIEAIQEKSMKEIGIPCLYGLDQIHGSTYVADGTLFPQGVNMAATFNPELAYATGAVTAVETRAAGIPWTFSPVMDMGRQPAWPRQWEGYGEDPLLSGVIGSSVVKGLQGDDLNAVDSRHIAACLKHYFAYGVPANGLDRTTTVVTVSEMREKQFAPFLDALRAGALSVMTNSSTVNGESGVASYKYLTQWLKIELNWDGMVVTDWADITSLYERDHIASSYKEAVKMTINGGVDMAMVPYSWQFCKDLKALVEEGEVPMSRIDDAVRRVLRMKYRLGLFENPVTRLADYPDFSEEASDDLSYRAAVESIVLLKNEKETLPIAKNKKILVAGPNANTMRALNGGWSYTWQGSEMAPYTTSYNTIIEAMKATFGENNIRYVPGVTYNERAFWTVENQPDIPAAVRAAKGVDYIMVCIGENSYCETVGNISNIQISENQRALVKALAKTGKPVILVLNEGRPRVINDLVPLSSAIVNVMLPSNRGGDALAALLAGNENFSGRLPYTYPSDCNGITTYDYKVCESRPTIEGIYDYKANTHIQWPFGYGLSYTSFSYSNLTVDKETFTVDDILTVTVDVTNTGDREGKESVQLYSADLYASLMPDNRRLRAFEKIELKPGETKTVTFALKGSDLAFVGNDGLWILEKGEFRLMVDNMHLLVNCSETYQWATPNR